MYEAYHFKLHNVPAAQGKIIVVRSAIMKIRAVPKQL